MDTESEQELLAAMQEALDSELPDRYEELVRIFRCLQPSGEGVFFGLVEIICRQEGDGVFNEYSDQALNNGSPVFPSAVRQKAILVLIRILNEKFDRLTKILAVEEDEAALRAAKKELAWILLEAASKLKVRSISHVS